MKTEIDLDLLRKIKQTPVSPFLFTRIQEKVNSLYVTNFSNNISLVLTLSAALLLMINFSSLLKLKSTESTMAKQIVEEMNLITTNYFYYE